MKKENIDILKKIGILKAINKDFEKVKSLITSSKENAEVTLSVPLNEKSATLIFREIYESIRQLGEAKWLLLGYEPQNHDITLDILKESEIREKVKLNHLDRYKNIRHDINYRGFKVSEAQTREIMEFWNLCMKEIIILIEKEITK